MKILPASALRSFERLHLSRLRPVVLRGLFEGQPVDAIRAPEAARAQLGDTRVRVVEEYLSSHRRSGTLFRPTPGRDTTLAAFLDDIARASSPGLVCTEQPLPDPLRALFEPPPHCAFGYREKVAVRALLYLAGRGSVANVHFDADLNHVLLHQVFGRKRVLLFPPSAAAPFEPVLNVGTVSLLELDDAERSALVARLGGSVWEVDPGETLYMPPLYWHHVEYLDTSMSFGLRFGRPRFADFLVKLHPSSRLQQVAFEMLRAGVDGPSGRAYRRLRRAYRRNFPDPRRKYEALEAILEELAGSGNRGRDAIGVAALIEQRLLYPEALAPT
jgi:hypothetical protein